MNHREIYKPDREHLWAQFDGGRISMYAVIGMSDMYYVCLGYDDKKFYIKKNKAFNTREDLKFYKFTQVCFDKPKQDSEKNNSKRWDSEKNNSKRWGIKELTRYLNETKQKEFAERFKKEYAEYLI